MKKYLLTAFLSVCCFPALFAQPITNNHLANQAMAFHGGYQQYNTGRTTSGNASRCIAKAVYDSIGIVTDSFTFSYSGANGSKPDGYPWKYDNSIHYSNSTGTYVNAQATAQTFDANDNIVTQLFQNWVSGGWVNSEQATYTYDGMNNQLTDSLQTWNMAASAWQNELKTISTYSGAHNMTSITDLNWDTATNAWMNNSMSFLYYDGVNNLILSLGFSWNTTTGTWDTSNKSIYAYDGSNDNTSITILLWTSAGVWDSVAMDLGSDFVNHFPQTAISMQKNSSASPFVNAYETLYTLNSYNQISYLYTKTWNPSGAGSWQVTSNDIAERLYYELYASIVPGVNIVAGKATMYPVPAKNTLSVDITWDEAQAFTIAMYDVLGHKLRSWMVPATAHYTNALNVGDVPAGNYIMKIQGDKGNLVDQVIVVN